MTTQRYSENVREADTGASKIGVEQERDGVEQERDLITMTETSVGDAV